MKDDSPRRSSKRAWAIAAATAMIAFVLSAARVNHGLVDSALPAGPGLTLDESINIRQGQYLFDALCQHGPLLLLPGAATQVYARPEYLPDHPPLARFVIGAAHDLTAWMIPGADQAVACVPAARLGSCFGFAVTTALLAFFSARRFGSGTAILACAAFLAMPRVVGHSRLAALETLTSLAWLAALVPLMAWWTGDRPPTFRQAVVSGLFWGILMLTKIQGILLPPVIVIWALVRFRRHALIPLLIWGGAGFLVFFLGWPWLWLDPVEHTRAYLLRTTERPTIYCWYLGQRFADKDVPWHYPFVLCTATVPLHSLAGSFAGILRRDVEAVDRLLLLSVLLPLCVFAAPGTPVYDGVRLFLFVMPAIALLTARGIVGVWTWLPEWRHFRGRAVLARSLMAIIGLLILGDWTRSVLAHGPMAADTYNIAIHQDGSEPPLWEACYWGDALNGEFWRQVPEGATVYMAPVLHEVLLGHMQIMVPEIQHRRIQLEPFLYDPMKQRGLVLLLHRLADLRPDLRSAPPGSTVVAEVQLHGTTLARLVDTTESTWSEIREW